MGIKANFNGIWKNISVKTSDNLPIGFIGGYGSDTPPSGWLICDGSAVSRTIYKELFEVIGTSYGTGDGINTFNLPDIRGKVVVGKSNETEFNTIGKTGGSKTNNYNFQHAHTTGNHTLTVNQIPSHGHGLNSGTDFRVGGVQSGGVSRKSVASGNSGYAFVTDSTSSNSALAFSSVASTGGGQAHNHGNTGNALGTVSISTLQSYLIANYIIKAKQEIAVVGNVKNENSDSCEDTYSCNYINNNLCKVTDSTGSKISNFNLSGDSGILSPGIYYLGENIIDSLQSESDDSLVDKKNTIYIVGKNSEDIYNETIISNDKIYYRTRTEETLSSGDTVLTPSNWSIHNLNNLNVKVVTEANTDLNDYTETGVYYFSADTSFINGPDAVNGWLQVFNTLNGTIKQIFYRHGTINTSDYCTYVRTKTTQGWSSWQRFMVENDLFYKAGDTFSDSIIWSDGFITSDTKQIRWDIYLPKQMDNVSVELVSGSVIMRGIGGYINGSSEISMKGETGITTSLRKNKGNRLSLWMENSAKWSNATNNTPVAVEVRNISLKFK